MVKADLAPDQVERMQQALLDTFADANLASCREKLLLRGVSLSEQEDYWVMEAFKDYASKHGFPTLR